MKTNLLFCIKRKLGEFGYKSILALNGKIVQGFLGIKDNYVVNTALYII